MQVVPHGPHRRCASRPLVSARGAMRPAAESPDHGDPPTSPASYSARSSGRWSLRGRDLPARASRRTLPAAFRPPRCLRLRTLRAAAGTHLPADGGGRRGAHELRLTARAVASVQPTHPADPTRRRRAGRRACSWDTPTGHAEVRVGSGPPGSPRSRRPTLRWKIRRWGRRTGSRKRPRRNRLRTRRRPPSGYCWRS